MHMIYGLCMYIDSRPLTNWHAYPSKSIPKEVDLENNCFEYSEYWANPVHLRVGLDMGTLLFPMSFDDQKGCFDVVMIKVSGIPNELFVRAYSFLQGAAP